MTKITAMYNDFGIRKNIRIKLKMVDKIRQDIMRSDPVKISVIMPVYNAGIYLREALQSLFAQSFQEFELICVNDASNDETTEEILWEFQSQYCNMNVVKSEKKIGAAEARNKGFVHARGEFVIFLDSDDLFASDLLEKMFCCIQKNDADVCVCGFEQFYTKHGKRYYFEGYIPDEHKIFCDENEKWLLEISTVPWNKLCRTDYLKKNHIYFQTLTSNNDVFFSCMLMINTKKRCFVDGLPLVLYRTGTQTQISVNRNPVNLYKAAMLLKNVIESRKIVEEGLLKKWIYALLVFEGITELRRGSNQKFKKEFYSMISSLFKSQPVCFCDPVLNYYMKGIKTRTFESGWFYASEIHYEQMISASDILKKKLDRKMHIFLWGLGNRGNAFQKYCKNYGIILDGIADIKNENVGSITEYGNKIISTKEITRDKGLIVAANNIVYEYLIHQNIHMDILNLEEFCPNMK